MAKHGLSTETLQPVLHQFSCGKHLPTPCAWLLKAMGGPRLHLKIYPGRPQSQVYLKSILQVDMASQNFPQRKPGLSGIYAHYHPLIVYTQSNYYPNLGILLHQNIVKIP